MSNWNISPHCLNQLILFVQEKNISTMIELGSGDSTNILREKFDSVISIEESEEFANRLPNVDNHLCIHAPIVNNWYDVSILNDTLLNMKFDFLLVDGPAHGNRIHLIEHINSIFHYPTYICLDDAERGDGIALGRAIESMGYKELVRWIDNKHVAMFKLESDR